MTASDLRQRVEERSCEQVLERSQPDRMLKHHQFAVYDDTVANQSEFTASGEAIENAHCLVKFTSKAFAATDNVSPYTKANFLVVQEQWGMGRSGLWLAYRVARHSVDSVTGIVQAEGAVDATVEYTWKLSATEFTADVGLNVDTVPHQRGQASLRRYDDGWRIVSVNSRN